MLAFVLLLSGCWDHFRSPVVSPEDSQHAGTRLLGRWRAVELAGAPVEGGTLVEIASDARGQLEIRVLDDQGAQSPWIGRGAVVVDREWFIASVEATRDGPIWVVVRARLLNGDSVLELQYPSTSALQNAISTAALNGEVAALDADDSLVVVSSPSAALRAFLVGNDGAFLDDRVARFERIAQQEDR
jgi:hypothetical protein